MQALRRMSCPARPLASTLRSTSASTTQRLAPLTAPFNPASTSVISSFSTSSTALATHAEKAPSGVASGESIIPISNIQAQWETMTEEERSVVHEQLEELQSRDWRSLSLDEKRAAYYVAFGPHGSRVPATKQGEQSKVALGVLAALAATGVLWTVIRQYAKEPPRTMTKEWQAASNERALEQKQNPITGIASEGYKGKGHIQSK